MRKKGEKLTINIANIKSRILLLFHGTSSVKKVRCIIVKKKKLISMRFSEMDMKVKGCEIQNIIILYVIIIILF